MVRPVKLHWPDVSNSCFITNAVYFCITRKKDEEHIGEIEVGGRWMTFFPWSKNSLQVLPEIELEKSPLLCIFSCINESYHNLLFKLSLCV